MAATAEQIDKLKSFLQEPAFEVADIPSQPSFFAGALAAGAVKVPVQTILGNMVAYEHAVPKFNLPTLSSGSVANSWSSGTAKVVAPGDLTIGNASRNAQRVKGTAMATALNDDVRAMAVLGREWREFHLLNSTTWPSGDYTIIPARDTHRILIFRDTTVQNILLATTGLVAGMKFMFVNLSASEAGTNEVQTITESVNITAGTYTITFGGQTTTAIQHDATAATVQAALELLSTIGAGNIAVTGGPVGTTPLTLTFRNALGFQDVAQVTVDVTSLTGTVTVATATPGVAGQGKLQVVSNLAGIAGSSINRLVLSPGAVVTLQAVHPDAAAALGSKYIITNRFGTVTSVLSS